MPGTELRRIDLGAIRRALRSDLARSGRGSWRLTDDVLDAAYDEVVDRMLARGAGLGQPTAFARAVLRNLVRSGPDRVGLHRARVARIPADLETPPGAQHPSPAAHRIPPSALEGLTAAERRAVTAAAGSPTVTAAAASAGMTPRAYRTRVSRAARKIRGFMAEHPCPPP
jgi:DNA-directed RNA polymerase specialized sigma24 family protein